MVRRRNVLTVATSAVVALSGCLSSFQANPGGGGQLEVGEDTRAEGNPKDLTITELEGDFEYYPGNDTIQYPAKRSDGEVIEYNFGEYEEWVDAEAQNAAINAVSNVYSPAISKRNNIWIERTPKKSPSAHGVVYQQKVNEDGEVVEEPDIDISSLIQEIPKSVDVKIEFDGNEDELSFPFYIYNIESKQVFGSG